MACGRRQGGRIVQPVQLMMDVRQATKNEATIAFSFDSYLRLGRHVPLVQEVNCRASCVAWICVRVELRNGGVDLHNSSSDPVDALPPFCLT